jgi:hypothetical protein
MFAIEDKNEIKHRGRIQAQGKDLDESEAWAQTKPLSLTKGLELVDILEAKLEPKDRKRRKIAFEKCRQFIINASENGGYPGKSKSFLAQAPHERVDIEVHLGIAFVKE